MKPSTKLQIITAVLLGILIYFFFGYQQRQTMLPDGSEQLIEQQFEETDLNSNEQLNSPINTKISETNTSSTCISQHEFNQKPAHVIVENFLYDHFGIAKVDYANYLAEEELLELAKKW